MKKFVSEAKAYLMITVGTLLLTMGVYFFKVPNGFATGGVSGVGTILGRVIPALTTGQWILLINAALLVLGAIILGKTNGIRTVFCSLLFSGLTYLFELVLPIGGPLTDQPFLELIYAMLLTGAGSAIIFYNQASSGGTDIVALILKKYMALDVGKALLATDFLIAASTFFVFGVQPGLFSVLGLFIKAFLVDSIIDNFGSCKYFVVITDRDKSGMINTYIMKELKHSATETDAVGSYSGADKIMIHTVCKRMEAIRLRQYIRQMDPHAFVIITTTSEIVGKGFRSV